MPVALPIAHLADHWLVYIIYTAPVIVVVVAIAASAIRERTRRRDQTSDAGLSPEGQRDGDRASP